MLVLDRIVDGRPGRVVMARNRLSDLEVNHPAPAGSAGLRLVERRVSARNRHDCGRIVHHPTHIGIEVVLVLNRKASGGVSDDVAG